MPPTDVNRTTRTEAAFASTYFAVYLGYLFVRPEGEGLHWISLVLVPLLGLFVIGRYPSLKLLLHSIGLNRLRPATGLGWLITFSVGFQLLQLMNRRQRVEILSIVREPFGFLIPVLAGVVLLLTVATTEEVFFRGVLQTRLAAHFRSPFLGLLVATVAFAAYHVPYAYLKPSWPSAGDFAAAVKLAAVNGGVGGAALGFVYWRSGNGLFAAMLLHAAIDLLPATRLVHRLLFSG